MERLNEINDEIISQIYFIRGRKVMLDSDLARLYGVTTMRMNEQVRRNIDRFPSDFMFRITAEEYHNLISQIAISSSKSAGNKQDANLILQNATSSWGGRRKLPLVFTEHGTLMLASVLRSPTAIYASIYVVRAFVKLREFLSVHKELAESIADLEKRTFGKLEEHSEQLILVFKALRELVQKKDEPREPVGFKIGIQDK